ncbi:MAG: hypothetical protein ABIF87_14410 [Pseudomonadota bacterium]
MKKTVFVLMVALLMGLPEWAPAQSKATRPSGTAAAPQKAVVSEMSVLHSVRIESASVLSEGELVLDARLAVELDRELSDRDYDNVRLTPIGMRYGVDPSLEVGGFLGFSANDKDDRLAPDDSGLEGLTVFGKLTLNESAALQVGLTFIGDDDVFPYPNDGLDLFVNLPLQRKIGEGLLYGEFGYTVQGGDLDTNDYFNFGIGYAFPVSEEASLNVELAGEEGQLGTSWNNTLDLLLGANFIVDERLRIAPFVTFGLYEASPDFSLGSTLEMRF